MQTEPEPESLTYTSLLCYKSLFSFLYLGAESAADACDFHCIISKKRDLNKKENIFIIFVFFIVFSFDVTAVDFRKMFTCTNIH